MNPIDPQQNRPTVILVVPCYNEAGRLKPEVFLERGEAGRDIGFLFVDDGSTDATPSILADMASRSGGTISVLTMKRNLGKASAVRLGMLAVFERKPEFAGFWDADLATPLTSVPEFVEVFRARPQVEIGRAHV